MTLFRDQWIENQTLKWGKVINELGTEASNLFLFLPEITIGSSGVEKYWHTDWLSMHPGFLHTYFSAVARSWTWTRTGTWPGLWCWSGAYLGSTTRVGVRYISLLGSWRWVRLRAWTVRRSRSWSRAGGWRWGPATGWVGWPVHSVAWKKGMRRPSPFLLFQRRWFQRFLSDPFGRC